MLHATCSSTLEQARVPQQDPDTRGMLSSQVSNDGRLSHRLGNCSGQWHRSCQILVSFGGHNRDNNNNAVTKQLIIMWLVPNNIAVNK